MKNLSIIYTVLLVNILLVFTTNLKAQNPAFLSTETNEGFVQEKGILKYTLLTPNKRYQMLTVVIAPIFPVKEAPIKRTNYDSSSEMSVFNPNYNGNTQAQINQPEYQYVKTPTSYRSSGDLSGLARLGMDLLSGALRK
jgi:hypothetical protein